MPECLAAIEEGSEWEHTDEGYTIRVTQVVLDKKTHELSYIEYDVTDDEWLDEQVRKAKKLNRKSLIDHVRVDVSPVKTGCVVTGENDFRAQFDFLNTA